jgi:serine phosphatase RsbU (regulator of sigma subunit)
VNLFPAKVLLVEDDDGDALLVQEMLEDAAPHVEIVRATSLAETLALEIEGAVACVLLDLGLPDAHGLQALERVREQARRVPVIVLTGHADEQAGIESLGAGAQEYLVKGRVDGELLLRAIRYAVERTQAESSRRELLEAQLQARENARLERGLLPTPLLRDPAVDFATTYRPGRRQALLGGDFYDAVELSDGSIVVTIGDVSGHGPDEAALGACLRIAWRALMLAELPLPDALAVLDRVLVDERHEDDIYATALFAHVAADRASGEIYTAGHPPGLLLTGDGPVPLPSDHIHVPLGLPAAAPWTPTRVDLGAGAGLLLYTDGLIEGHIGRGRERLGVEGLVELVGRIDGRVGDRAENQASLVALVAEVERLNGGELVDDLAVALLSWA